jgi:FkbM family methyltransferase
MKVKHDIKFAVRESAIIADIFENDAYRFRPWVEKVEDACVVDLGANLGAFTLLAASYGCRVIAVEADPTMLGVLKQNLSANPWANVIVVPVAVTATDGMRWMHSSDTMSGGLMRAYTGYKPVERPSRTLKYICEQHRVFTYGVLDHQAVAYKEVVEKFLKCDIEGSECEVFGHDVDTISSFDAISMEWHNYDGLLFAALLRERGFDDVMLEGAGHPPPPYDPTIGGGLLHAR